MSKIIRYYMLVDRECIDHAEGRTSIWVVRPDGKEKCIFDEMRGDCAYSHPNSNYYGWIEPKKLQETSMPDLAKSGDARRVSKADAFLFMLQHQ